jgi:AcrR family transcriptional regulator
MSSTRPYRARPPRPRSTGTRDKIVATVREMLAEGSFHEASVEQVADRAGVSRATVYQHFASRLELVDTVCDVMGVNPALVEIRKAIGLPDALAALDRVLAYSVKFWSSESPVLRELYGVVAIEPGARAFVDRQRADRSRELERLAESLSRSGRLAPGVTRRDALVTLLLLTSFETYCELREAGLSDRQVTAYLKDAAARELVAPAG